LSSYNETKITIAQVFYKKLFQSTDAAGHPRKERTANFYPILVLLLLSVKILKACLGADEIGSDGAFLCYFFCRRKVKEAVCIKEF